MTLLQKYLSWFDRLKSREQKLISLGGMVVIFTVGYVWFISPLETQNKHLKKELLHLKQTELSQSEQSFTLQNSETEATHHRSQDLEAKYKQILAKIDHNQDLGDVLTYALSDFKGLTLVSFESLPSDSNAAYLNFIPHQYLVHLQGKYSEILYYLEWLDQSPGLLYVDDYEYRISQFPIADISLTLTILSKTNQQNQPSGEGE